MIVKGANRCLDALSNPQAAPTYHPGRKPKVYTLEKLNARGFGLEDTQQQNMR